MNVPPTFPSIIGHENEIALLRRTLRTHRVAPAYLFAGPDHVGKKTVARIFASALNCERGGDDACGACLSCRKVADENHPDVRFVRPDGATFRIDQVRDIRKQIALRPFEGRYKVFVLVGVEKMRQEGANALLKTLEEPPGDGVLALVTSNLHALQPTIRSRSQILRFRPVPLSVLTAGLIARGVPDEMAREIALLSEGRVGRALERLASQERTFEDAIPEPLSQPSLLRAFRLAESWSKEPESLDTLLTWYRDLFLLRLGAPTEMLTHVRHRQALRLLASQETTPSLRAKMKAIMEARSRLQRNINAALTLETLAFRLIETPLLMPVRTADFV